MYPPTKTRRASPAKIRRAVDRIVHRYLPIKVIQFGSHAQGMTSDDDVHLLVVVDACADKRRMIASILDDLGDAGFAKEVLVTTCGELGETPRLGSIIPIALTEGKVLYERPEG